MFMGLSLPIPCAFSFEISIYPKNCGCKLLHYISKSTLFKILPLVYLFLFPDKIVFMKAAQQYLCVICQEYQLLAYHTTNWDGYKEYKSDPSSAPAARPERCIPTPKVVVKTVQRHIWKEYAELADIVRHTPERLIYTDSEKRRQCACLPTRRKIAQCVLRSIEVWIRRRTGQGSSLPP